MKVLLLVVTTLSLSLSIASSQECNEDKIGDSICEKFTPYFTEYQYATCVPAEYILEQTDGLFQCENVNAEYCWHKCMIEQFNTQSGQVEEECVCTPAIQTNGSTTTKSPSTKPPKKCYQPSSNDCSFYLDCLDKTGPNCTSYRNSLQYAMLFCEVYNQNFTQYSLHGKSWLKAVEKCFQVSMKPLMSASNSNKKKCKDHKNDMKKKKSSCYLTPGKNEPSICDLSCDDWHRIFWTLKNESDVFTLAEDLSEFLRIFKGCKDLEKRCSNDSYVPTVSYKLKFKGKKSLDFTRAKVDDDRDYDTVAAEVADSLWRQMKYNSLDHDIFGFVENADKPISANELHVQVWVLSKKDLDASSWSNSATLKKINDDLAKAIAYGSISLSVDINNQKVLLASADPCINDLCSKTGASITYNSQKLPFNNVPDKICPNFIILLMVTVLIVLINFNN